MKLIPGTIIGPKSWGRTFTIILLNVFSIKLNPDDIAIPTDQCISQHPLGKLLLAVDGD